MGRRGEEWPECSGWHPEIVSPSTARMMRISIRAVHTADDESRVGTMTFIFILVSASSDRVMKIAYLGWCPERWTICDLCDGQFLLKPPIAMDEGSQCGDI